MRTRGDAARNLSGQRRTATHEPRRVTAPNAERRANLHPGATQGLTGLLASLPIFRSVPERSLSRMAAQMCPRHVPAGTTLFRQGDPAREFLVIASGRLEVTLEGANPETPAVAIIEAPGWAGELALMLDEPRAVTLTAAADSEVWVLPGDAFDRFVARHQVVARNLLAALTRRILEKDQDFLGQSSLAIERARLVNELRERNTELAALAEVTRAVSASLDLDEALQTITTNAAQLTGSESVTIFLYDEQRDKFEVRASCNTPEEYLLAPEERRLLSAGLGRTEPAPSPSLIAQAVMARTPLQIPDVDAATGYSSRDLLLRWGYGAVLGVPLLHGTRVIGAMIVRRKRAGEFSEREVELVTTFARQSAVAIENARLFREIQEKARQVEVVSRHKSQFLASMSHELRTPLNAIIGFSEILLDPAMSSLPEPEQQEFLTNILTSGRHLLRLINDILDLSKVEAGKMELHPAPVSLSETTEGVLATLKSLAMKKQLRMECRLAPDLPPVWADPPRLKQILYNLVSNAIKFTPVGGRVSVTARIATGAQKHPEHTQETGEPTRLASKLPAPLQFLEIGVTDTGIGIPAEDLDRIFGEFEQVAHSSRQGQEGTGLGLTLVKKLVEMQGGIVGVTSTPGQGTTFTFSIPIAG